MQILNHSNVGTHTNIPSPQFQGRHPTQQYRINVQKINVQKHETTIYIMNHDSGFIIGIAMIFFAKTLIEHTPKSHLKKHPSA